MKHMDMFLTSRRNSSREKEKSKFAAQQETKANKMERQFIFSELACSQGHYEKGSLAGLAQKNKKLQTSAKGSLIESQSIVGKLTPDTGLAKASEKNCRINTQAGLESSSYKIRSATSVDIFKDLLDGNVELLNNTDGSQGDIFSVTPQVAISQALRSLNEPETRPSGSSVNLLFPKTISEGVPSHQPYSNSHLNQIMGQLREFVTHKDIRIGILENENSKLKAILATHGIAFPGLKQNDAD
jgi:hypothetical protein